jgi:2'-5' RNA ligase
MMDKIRTFITIELPQSVKIVLKRLQIDLGADKDAFVKWVKPDSIHLTLKFLGNINPEKTSEISAAMANVAQNTKPFLLSVSQLGAFPNTRSPRIIWVGLTNDTNILAGLQKRLDQSLASVGFAMESKTFSPHLTLGRVRNDIRPDQRRALAEKLTTTGLKSNPPIRVIAINLMQSDLTPQGALYTQLAGINLSKRLVKAN